MFLDKQTKLGFLTLLLSLSLMFVGMVLTPLLFATTLDPFYLIVASRFPDLSTAQYYALRAVLFLWLHYFVFESSRVLITLLVPVMAVCSVYLACLDVLLPKRLNEQTLNLYHQIHCINQVGMHLVGHLAAALIGISFPVLVLGNWVMLVGWSIYPLLLYCVFCGAPIVVFIVLFQTMPLIIMSNELSYHLISTWRYRATFKVKDRRYWIKVLKAERPVAFNYVLTKFEKGTDITYYSFVFCYTINLFLII